MMENVRLLLGAIALLSGLKVGWEFLLGPRAALRQVVPEMFGEWKAENLVDYSVPHFFHRPDRTVDDGSDRSVTAGDIQDLFKVYGQQLGRLKSYRVVEEKIGQNSATDAKASTYASYKLAAEFEKAPATIRLYLDLYGSWKLSHFIVQSEALSPCLAQVDWQLCSAEQAKKATPKVVQQSVQRLLNRRECVNCDLSYVNLAGADLTKVNLTGANLTGTNLAGAHLNGAKLRQTKLKSANLTEALLVGADLRGAVAPAVNFNRAKLAGADLSGDSI
ncbi:MAG: pentapeptide repeat-containing protein [Alkalinema sp. RU_4_3]|nr:pentapeptide repeat-containing protein [Alkalinema sp. RU_4_3]